MTFSKKSIVIVGGGISGLLATVLLQDLFKNVYIIEKNNELGGLLRSCQNQENDVFDMGTHIPAKTNLKIIDDILFKEMNSDKWNIFSRINVSNFFENHLNNHTCIDARKLSSETYKNGTYDMLHNNFFKNKPENLREHFIQHLGETFFQEIYEPISQKFFGCSCEELHPLGYTFFGLHRIIAFNDFLTKELKKSPLFDNILSFHNEDDAFRNSSFYYPKENGINQWIDVITKQFKNVEILTNESITSFDFANGENGKKINSLTISSGKKNRLRFCCLECTINIFNTSSKYFYTFI